MTGTRGPGTGRPRPVGAWDLPLLLAALAAVLAWDLSGLDLWASHRFGGPAGFAWRDAPWASAVLHDGGRQLAVLALLLLAWDAARPLLAGPGRAARAGWLGVVLLTALAVPALKRISHTSCPWDLAEFGGAVRHVSHWLPGVVDGGPGHCFPSGHAVSAFAFIGLYFLWRPQRPRLARALLAAVLALGTLFAWAQLVRGAHFVSHSLWSAWLCAAIAVVAEKQVFSRGAARPGRLA